MINYVHLASSLGIAGFIAGDEYRAACPFHQDRTPSFSLNTGSGLSICHRGCFQGTFVALVERVMDCSPAEAYAWILNEGNKAGVQQVSKQLAASLNLVPGINNQSQVTNNWLESFQRLDNRVMPIWFHERGFSWKTISDWDIRYEPVQDAVVIPVINGGELVGTITRRYRMEPKYLNSEFSKREILFGLDKVSRSSRLIILVEGPLDCIWASQCGLPAVALLGSRISEAQADLLIKAKFGEVVLALDNDEAGIIGTQHAVKLLTSKGFLHPQIKIMNYPKPFKDAQELTPEQLYIVFTNRKDALLHDLLTI